MNFLPMRSASPLLSACLVLAAATFMLPVGARRAGGEEPPVYAITNAKVVPVSAPTIERGTVVIRRGVI